jgi:hypothetical protein
VLIPMRTFLGEGLSYQRPKRGLLESLRPKAPASGPHRAPAKATAGPPKRAGSDTRVKPEPSSESLLAQAERAVVRVASRTPKKFVPRRTIEGQLQQIDGFKKKGPHAYFGRQHYQGLMTELAKRNKRLKVQPGRSQSASVMYVPEE